MTSRQILRRPAVMDRVGLRKSQIAELVRAGKFPAPVQLSQRAVGWYADEVDKWISDRPRAGVGAA